MTAQVIQIEVNSLHLEGSLGLPPEPQGVIIFAHGSESSRYGLRHLYVAQALQALGLATLRFDLLTPTEEQLDLRTARLRFDIHLLAQRLLGGIDWIAHYPPTASLPIGFFGASTGGAAALVAAAERPEMVQAIVARGGRPDLAGAALARVRTPTLLIAGGRDLPVIQFNEATFNQLMCEKKLEIIPEAGHLFEEPGALAEVARLAAHWFEQHLSPVAA